MRTSSARTVMFALIAATPIAARAADSTGQDLEEIVVTAEKSSAPLSKVPISISVVSSEQLAEQHINDYESLSRAVPNLSFSSFGGPGQSNIEIRGVASQAGSATTGIYLDDVPINILNIYSAGATEPRFFDVDRVEVLRGPQGTIYGSGSMGGTLHFVSRAPALDKFEASMNSAVSDTEGGAANGEIDSVVNLPLVDGKAALRIGGLFDHESGWIDRNAAGTIVDQKINHVNTSVVRATLEWRPTDQLIVTPAVFLQRVSVGGQDLFSLDLPLYESPTLLAETARDEYAMTSLTLKYDFGWSDLTSVTGYFWRRNDRNIDGTFYDSRHPCSSIRTSTRSTRNCASPANPALTMPGRGLAAFSTHARAPACSTTSTFPASTPRSRRPTTTRPRTCWERPSRMISSTTLSRNS